MTTTIVDQFHPRTDIQDILRRVIDRLNLGWCKGANFLPSGNEPVVYDSMGDRVHDFKIGTMCLDGALRYAMTDNPWHSPDPQDAYQVYRLINEMLYQAGMVTRETEVIPSSDGIQHFPWTSTVGFNDYSHRTLPQVIEAVRYVMAEETFLTEAAKLRGF